jgi:hypothetical protein
MSGTCGNASNTDDQLACRSVSIQIQDVSNTNTPTEMLPVVIVRPPLALIHGLWDNAKAWDNFSPLVSQSTADQRFSLLHSLYQASPTHGSLPASVARDHEPFEPGEVPLQPYQL